MNNTSTKYRGLSALELDRHSEKARNRNQAEQQLLEKTIGKINVKEKKAEQINRRVTNDLKATLQELSLSSVVGVGVTNNASRPLSTKTRESLLSRRRASVDAGAMLSIYRRGCLETAMFSPRRGSVDSGNAGLFKTRGSVDNGSATRLVRRGSADNVVVPSATRRLSTENATECRRRGSTGNDEKTKIRRGSVDTAVELSHGSTDKTIGLDTRHARRGSGENTLESRRGSAERAPLTRRKSAGHTLHVSLTQYEGSATQPIHHKDIGLVVIPCDGRRRGSIDSGSNTHLLSRSLPGNEISASPGDTRWARRRVAVDVDPPQIVVSNSHKHGKSHDDNHSPCGNPFSQHFLPAAGYHQCMGSSENDASLAISFSHLQAKRAHEKLNSRRSSLASEVTTVEDDIQHVYDGFHQNKHSKPRMPSDGCEEKVSIIYPESDRCGNCGSFCRTNHANTHNESARDDGFPQQTGLVEEQRHFTGEADNSDKEFQGESFSDEDSMDKTNIIKNWLHTTNNNINNMEHVEDSTNAPLSNAFQTEKLLSNHDRPDTSMISSLPSIMIATKQKSLSYLHQADEVNILKTPITPIPPASPRTGSSRPQEPNKVMEKRLRDARRKAFLALPATYAAIFRRRHSNPDVLSADDVKKHFGAKKLLSDFGERRKSEQTTLQVRIQEFLSRPLPVELGGSDENMSMLSEKKMNCDVEVDD